MPVSSPKTQYFVAASIDGFIADENDNLDWLTQLEGPEDEVNPYDAFIEKVGPLAMGATTYEWIRRHYPDQWFYGDRPTWVFTHRDLPAIEGANLVFSAADVAEVHADMVTAAGEGKNIWLVGGGDLVRQFAERGLLDEIRLSIAPVTLGKGAPLLPWRHTTPLRLESVEHVRGGTFVHLVYALDNSP